MPEKTPEYNIGIIGCGKMGSDLFGWLTGFPFEVTWVCRTKKQAEKQTEKFYKKLNRSKKFGLQEEDFIEFRRKNTLITSRLDLLSHCHLVIETITEDLSLKKQLFRKLEKIFPDNCVLASNTSSFSPDELFQGFENQRNCLGLHFFFPVAMKSFVELNIAESTGKQAIQIVEKFLKLTGKLPFKLTGNDHFIINRMFLKMQAGCCRLLYEGKMDVAEIDLLIKQHLFPVGIFEFFDYVGNDVMLQSVQNYMAFESNHDFYRPMIDMLELKVKEKKLGKKTKIGFYDYTQRREGLNSDNQGKQQEVLQKIIYWYLDGVFNVLNRGICNKEDLSLLVMEYMDIATSPFDLAERTEYLPR